MADAHTHHGHGHAHGGAHDHGHPPRPGQLRPCLRDRHRRQPVVRRHRGLLRLLLARRFALAAGRCRPQPRRRGRAGDGLGRCVRRQVAPRCALHLRLETRVDPGRLRQRGAVVVRDGLAGLGGGRPARRSGADRRHHRDGGGRHRHRRQPCHGAALHARPPRRPEHSRRLPAHGERCVGLGRCGRHRRAGARDRLALARSGGEPGDRAGDRDRHLGLVPPVAAPDVRCRARAHRSARGACPARRLAGGDPGARSARPGPPARPRSR